MIFELRCFVFDLEAQERVFMYFFLQVHWLFFYH